MQELEGTIQQLKTQLKNKESSLQAATAALSEEKTRSGMEKEEASKKHQLLLEQERNATAAEKVRSPILAPDPVQWVLMGWG